MGGVGRRAHSPGKESFGKMVLTSTHKMGVAALIMAGSVLLSRFMGLVRDKVVSWQFGAGAEADIYFAAFVVPDFINYLLAGGYISITLIPMLSRRFEEDGEDAWAFFSAVFWWVCLSIGVLTLVAWICAPNLARLAGPGFSAPEQARLAFFLRIILPAQIFFLPGACLSALLYIRRQFSVPALTPLVYNGCIIAGGLLMPGRGMEGFCWGVLIGAALGAFLMPLFAVSRGEEKDNAGPGLRLLPVLRHPLLKKLLLLALPLMIGVSVVVLDEQFVRIFGSLAGEGSVSLLNYARRIMMVPVGVVAQAAGMASFPFLASLAAGNDNERFDATLNTALYGSLCLVLPLTAYMMATAVPILGLIFEGGRFSRSESLLAAPLLQIMLLSVPFWVVQQILSRAFYARQDTLTPAVIGSLATVVVLPLYPAAVRHLGSAGVAALTALSLFIYTLALVLAWKRRRGGAAFSGLVMPVCRMVIILVPCFCLTRLCTVLLPPLLSSVCSGLPSFLLHAITLTAALLVFTLPCLLLVRLLLPQVLRMLPGLPGKRSRQSG